MQNGESPSIQAKARPCFSREAGSEEESTATQPNSPAMEAPSPGDLKSNTCGVFDGRQMSGTFYPLPIGRGKLDPVCKIRIYKIVLGPIVTYASAVRVIAAATHMHKLKKFQDRILRMALNAPWFVRNTILHEDAGVESLILRPSSGPLEPPRLTVS
ncbi:hypothetical protein Trydic_g17 [Trypoxylus dichotomus]